MIEEKATVDTVHAPDVAAMGVALALNVVPSFVLR